MIIQILALQRSKSDSVSTFKKKNYKYCGTFVREGKSEHTVCYDCVPTQPQPHRKLSNEFSDKTWWWFLFELNANSLNQMFSL